MAWIESRYKVTGQVGRSRREAGALVAALVSEPATEVIRQIRDRQRNRSFAPYPH